MEQLFQRPIFAHALLKVFFRNAPSFAPFCSFLEKGMPEASVLTRSHVYDVKENVQQLRRIELLFALLSFFFTSANLFSN